MPTDTQRLIVKRHVPGRTALGWAGITVVALLCLWGAFEAGRMLGGYSVVSAQLERRSLQAQLTDATARLQRVEALLAEAEVAKRVDRESYSQVGKSLAELQSRLGEQSQELSFYRGIVSPADGIGGMRIQRLQILPGIAPLRYRVRIVLVQAARQDAVAAASADLSVDGVQAGRAVSLPLAEIGASTKALTFSFRYFQEVETEIELPADFVPQKVQVEVRPAKGATPLRESYPWKIDTT
jgi:hypothetical protein